MNIVQSSILNLNSFNPFTNRSTNGGGLGSHEIISIAELYADSVVAPVKAIILIDESNISSLQSSNNALTTSIANVKALQIVANTAIGNEISRAQTSESLMSTNISSLQTNSIQANVSLATNSANITVAQTSLTNVKALQVIDESNISALQTSLSGLTSSLSTTNANIVNVKTLISTNATNIVSTQTSLTSFATTQATNTANISTLTTVQATNTASITALQATNYELLLNGTWSNPNFNSAINISKTGNHVSLTFYPGYATVASSQALNYGNYSLKLPSDCIPNASISSLYLLPTVMFINGSMMNVFFQINSGDGSMNLVPPANGGFVGKCGFVAPSILSYSVNQQSLPTPVVVYSSGGYDRHST